MALKIARRAIAVSGIALGGYVLLVRPWQRRWGATDEEVKSSLPGDELVSNPDVVLTRAITIQAKPAEIWPWLAQIGQGRGGYYSYDRLENLLGLKMKNAVSINPEWQHISVGDIIPAEPGGKGFKVLAVEPERSLVIGSVEANDEGVFEGFKQMFPAFTWAFVLEKIDDEHTRLISRLRGKVQPDQPVPTRMAGSCFEPIEFLMTRRMLLGIKQRAEQAGLSTVTTSGDANTEKPLKKGSEVPAPA
jgi:hypothetical protein